MTLTERISTQLHASTKEVRGVLRQSLAEAHGGFAASRFLAREAAGALIDQVDSGKTNFTAADLDIFVISLEFSLVELGKEEFQAITGYDFSFGVSTLAELRKAAKEQN